MADANVVQPRIRDGLPGRRARHVAGAADAGAAAAGTLDPGGAHAGDPLPAALGGRASAADLQQHTDPSADSYHQVLRNLDRELTQGLTGLGYSVQPPPPERARSTPTGYRSTLSVPASAMSPLHGSRPPSPDVARARREEQALAALQFSSQLDDVRRSLERDAADRIDRARQQTEEEYLRWKKDVLEDMRKLRRDLDQREEERHSMHTKLHLVTSNLDTLRREHGALQDREQSAVRLNERLKDTLRRVLAQSQDKDDRMLGLEREMELQQEAADAAEQDRYKLQTALSEAVQQLRVRGSLIEQLKLRLSGGDLAPRGDPYGDALAVYKEKVEAMSDEILRLQDGDGGVGAALRADLARLAVQLRSLVGGEPGGEDHDQPQQALRTVRECCQVLAEHYNRQQEHAAGDAGGALAAAEERAAAAERQAAGLVERQRELLQAADGLQQQLQTAELRAVAAADASEELQRGDAVTRMRLAEAEAEVTKQADAARKAAAEAQAATDQLRQVRSEAQAGRQREAGRRETELEAELAALRQTEAGLRTEITELHAQLDHVGTLAAEDADRLRDATDEAEAAGRKAAAAEKRAAAAEEAAVAGQGAAAAEQKAAAAEKRAAAAEERAAAAEAAAGQGSAAAEQKAAAAEERAAAAEKRAAAAEDAAEAAVGQGAAAAERKVVAAEERAAAAEERASAAEQKAAASRRLAEELQEREGALVRETDELMRSRRQAEAQRDEAAAELQKEAARRTTAEGEVERLSGQVAGAEERLAESLTSKGGGDASRGSAQAAAAVQQLLAEKLTLVRAARAAARRHANFQASVAEAADGWEQQLAAARADAETARQRDGQLEQKQKRIAELKEQLKEKNRALTDAESRLRRMHQPV